MTKLKFLGMEFGKDGLLSFRGAPLSKNIMAKNTVYKVLGSAIIAGSVLTGCGKKSAPEPITKAEPAEVKAITTSNQNNKQEEAAEDLLHQPFLKAVCIGDNPPEYCNRPPDVTVTKKSVYKLYEAVQACWDEIRFKDKAGNLIDYTAIISTDQGDIEMELFPTQAPNHVRNFIALAKVGYYDGLFFEEVHLEESEEPVVKLEQLRAGCPLGTGEVGYGSIGYWLKPEFSPETKHEAGTVGSFYELDPETSACRFYINLDKAPFMDENYSAIGKITKGMEVAKKIYAMPLKAENDEGSRKPEKPVTIKKITIQTRNSVNTVAGR